MGRGWLCLKDLFFLLLDPCSLAEGKRKINTREMSIAHTCYIAPDIHEKKNKAGEQLAIPSRPIELDR